MYKQQEGTSVVWGLGKCAKNEASDRGSYLTPSLLDFGSLNREETWAGTAPCPPPVPPSYKTSVLASPAYSALRCGESGVSWNLSGLGSWPGVLPGPGSWPGVYPDLVRGPEFCPDPVRAVPGVLPRPGSTVPGVLPRPGSRCSRSSAQTRFALFPEFCPDPVRLFPEFCPDPVRLFPLTMRRSRRRWLRVLLLVTAAALGSGAVTLRRDGSDALDSSWGGRDDCQKCPAGTYLAEECKEQHGSGRCEPCGEGEFMEYPNTFQSCQECSKCREDQVQLSPCQPSRNTVCACQDGTFCPPEHPCEMCQKCQPRCPEGQEVLKPCTADSDLQCGPATDSGTASKWTIGVITPVIAVVLVMVGLYIWKCLCRSTGGGRSSSKGPCQMMSSMFRKLKYKSVNVEAGDNATNEQRDPGTEPAVTPPAGSVRPKEPPSARPQWNLVPAPGEDPMQRLRGSFYTFAKKVYTENWKKFGRHLKLEENDVAMARTEDGVYEMLLTWQSREGAKASVNTLLEILEELNLGGVAEEISSILIQKGLFQAGAEGSGEQAAPPSFKPEPLNTSQNT